MSTSRFKVDHFTHILHIFVRLLTELHCVVTEQKLDTIQNQLPRHIYIECKNKKEFNISLKTFIKILVVISDQNLERKKEG